MWDACECVVCMCAWGWGLVGGGGRKGRVEGRRVKGVGGRVRIGGRGEVRENAEKEEGVIDRV